MATEFWNVIAAIIGGFIIGMTVHSAMGHTWPKRLWEIFHKDEKPYCYGKMGNGEFLVCDKCKYFQECWEKSLISKK